MVSRSMTKAARRRSASTTVRTASTTCTDTIAAARRHPRRFHAGTLGEGMRAAIAAVRADYKEIIAAWRTT